MNEPLKAPLHSPPPDLASYQKQNPPESKTPETDAAYANAPRADYGGMTAMTQHARSLELRLNEALAKLADTEERLKNMTAAHDENCVRIFKLKNFPQHGAGGATKERHNQ